jgi:hypothetical protein
MIKKYVSMILFSLYFCVSIGSKATAQGPLDDIDAASHAFDDAQFRKYAAAIDMFLADDFKFVRGSGKFTVKLSCLVLMSQSLLLKELCAEWRMEKVFTNIFVSRIPLNAETGVGRLSMYKSRRYCHDYTFKLKCRP